MLAASWHGGRVADVPVLLHRCRTSSHSDAIGMAVFPRSSAVMAVDDGGKMVE